MTYNQAPRQANILMEGATIVAIGATLLGCGGNRSNQALDVGAHCEDGQIGPKAYLSGRDYLGTSTVDAFKDVAVDPSDPGSGHLEAELPDGTAEVRINFNCGGYIGPNHDWRNADATGWVKVPNGPVAKFFASCRDGNTPGRQGTGTLDGSCQIVPQQP